MTETSELPQPPEARQPVHANETARPVTEALQAMQGFKTLDKEIKIEAANETSSAISGHIAQLRSFLKLVRN